MSIACGKIIFFRIQKLHLPFLHIFSHTAKDMFRAENPNKTEKEMHSMSTNTTNHLVNAAARDAMDKFKMEAASEVGVNLKNGYNGDLTSRQAGSVGGQMVKKMIEAYENGMK